LNVTYAVPAISLRYASVNVFRSHSSEFDPTDVTAGTLAGRKSYSSAKAGSASTRQAVADE
jgi:hypothetical protein